MDGSGVILRDGAVVDNSDNGRNEDDSDLLAISENSDQNPQDYLDIKQNERGIRVTVDRRRDVPPFERTGVDGMNQCWLI